MNWYKKSQVGELYASRSPLVSDQKRLDIAIDYESGMSKNDIISKHGISIWTLYSIVREMGVSHKKTYDENAIASDYTNTEMLNKEIAKKHGISISLLTKIVKKLGLPQRNKKQLTQEERFQIAEKAETGIPIADICMEHDISQPTVSMCIDEFGVDRPTIRHSRFSMEKQKEVIDSYLRTKNKAKTARETNVPENSITRILYNHGIETDLRVPTVLPEGELWNEFLSKYRSGEGYVRLCRELNLPPVKVRRKLIDLGEFRAGEGSMMPAEENYAVSMFDKGYTNVSELSNYMGFGESVLHRIFDLYMKNREKHHNYTGNIQFEIIPQNRRMEILEMSNQGYNYNAIAIHYGVSPGTIQVMLSDLRKNQQVATFNMRQWLSKQS
jgi:hypothetical protein